MRSVYVEVALWSVSSRVLNLILNTDRVADLTCIKEHLESGELT